MSAARVSIALGCLALGFLIGAWAFGRSQPQTCARVPNGIVCWHGVTEQQWGVR